jgi:hypothetical protein
MKPKKAYAPPTLEKRLRLVDATTQGGPTIVTGGVID